MNPQTAEIVSLPRNVVAPKGLVAWDVGTEFVARGCKFRVTYVNVAKQRITIEPVPMTKADIEAEALHRAINPPLLVSDDPSTPSRPTITAEQAKAIRRPLCDNPTHEFHCTGDHEQ